MLLRLLTNAQQGTLNRISVAKNSIKRVLYTIITPISEVLQYRQCTSHLVYFYPIFPLHRGGGIFVLIFTNFQLYIHIKSELQNLEKRYKFELHTKLYKGFFVELTYFTYLCIWLDVEKHMFSHLIGIAVFCSGSEAKLRVGHLQPTQSYLLYH